MRAGHWIFASGSERAVASRLLGSSRVFILIAARHAMVAHTLRRISSSDAERSSLSVIENFEYDLFDVAGPYSQGAALMAMVRWPNGSVSKP